MHFSEMVRGSWRKSALSKGAWRKIVGSTLGLRGQFGALFGPMLFLASFSLLTVPKILKAAFELAVSPSNNQKGFCDGFESSVQVRSRVLSACFRSIYQRKACSTKGDGRA